MVDTLSPPTETPGSEMTTAARALRRGRRPAAEAAPEPEAIPAGYTAEQWAEVKRLHKALGKDAEPVARDLHRFDNPWAGIEAPQDGDTLPEPEAIPADRLPSLHEASRKLEQKSLRRYMSLKAGIGQKLQDALSEYQEHRRRSARIMDRIAQ